MLKLIPILFVAIAFCILVRELFLGMRDNMRRSRIEADYLMRFGHLPGERAARSRRSSALNDWYDHD